MSAQRHHILLAITGSVAAYKACDLAVDWRREGFEVRVIMTPNAARFVSPMTFEALTGQRCRVDLFDTSDYGDGTIPHVENATWADVLVVAPATADITAKVALGIGDDYVSTTVLAARCPKILCPAMNTRMYDNPATQRNLAQCGRDGIRVIGPADGRLASGAVGVGRMSEIGEIEAAVREVLGSSLPAGDATALRGRTVLITAGPTQEPLDPVRYLTNHATGTMGYALAAAARRIGAETTLVTGPTALVPPAGVHVTHVTTAADMFDAVRTSAPAADLIIMAAAVADFAPAQVSSGKIAKDGRDELDLRFARTPDILAWLGAHRRADQVICGFAMETVGNADELAARARRKLEAKNCDMIVANNLNTPGAGFGTGTNAVTILSRGGERRDIGVTSKTSLAVTLIGVLAGMTPAGK